VKKAEKLIKSIEAQIRGAKKKKKLTIFLRNPAQIYTEQDGKGISPKKVFTRNFSLN